MKGLILFILILPIIYYASKYKKYYLYLVFAFYGVLPDTFAIEISTNLPLLTVKRMMILILVMGLFYKKHKTLKFALPKVIILYFLVNIAVSIINFRYGTSEINKIFILLFEELLFFISVIESIKNREELNRCFDFMIAGAVVESIIGITQTVFQYDISTVLDIVNTRGEQTDSSLLVRMGVSRAGGTMGAIQLGSYCAILILVTMYRYECTKHKKYICALFLEFCVMFCSMSRSSIGPLVLVVFFIILKNIKKYLHLYGKYLIGMIAIVCGICVINVNILSAIFELLKSMINTLGGTLQISKEFGANVEGFSSRFVQWTAILYMFINGGFIFGLGYNAYMRRMLYYFFPQFKSWVVAPALDVGLISIFSETGIIGFISWLILTGYILYVSQHKKNDILYKFFYYIMILYIILNICTVSASEVTWLLWSTFFAYERINKYDKLQLSL